MRDMMWIYAAIIFLVPEASGQDLGTNQSIFANSSTYGYGVANLTVNQGSDVNLTCSNKTWSETIYVIWNIHLKSNTCKIASSVNRDNTDSCKDGKSLRNTSRAESYLHISNVSRDDEGVYKCELVFRGGKQNHMINVAITVSPTVSVWSERWGDKMVAVCRAEGGKPAANISWSHGGKASVATRPGKDGVVIVESRLELTEDMDPDNLYCAVRHPSWEEKSFLLIPQKGDIPWWVVLVIVLSVISTVSLGGCVFLAQKKLIPLRRRQQSEPSSSKSPPTEDVEEVEPYASYVQRVNSIYN